MDQKTKKTLIYIPLIVVAFIIAYKLIDWASWSFR